MGKYYSECEVCKNKGWVKSVTFGSQFISDNSEVIEKCDECGVFHNDFEAAKFAYKSEKVLTFLSTSGFNILMNFSEN